MRDLESNWVEKLSLNPDTRSKEFKSNAKTKGRYSNKAKIINRKKKRNPKSMSTDLYHID